MDHVCGAPNQPQTQGKIERWHQTLKNHILLENYYLEGELEAAIDPSAHSSITSIHRAEALQTKITPPVPNHSTTDTGRSDPPAPSGSQAKPASRSQSADYERHC